MFSAPDAAILINLDGEPIWSRSRTGSPIRREHQLGLFEHTPSKTFYLRYNESWLQAPT